MVKKLAKKQIIILAILIAVIGIVMSIANPFKVTDPSDPRFNPDKFRFSDYSYDDDSLRDAFRKLFPIGTPKEYVDRVLVDAGNARMSQDPTYDELYLYYEPKWHRLRHFMKGPPHYNFIFDEDMRVVNIMVGAGLYPGQPVTSDLKYRED